MKRLGPAAVSLLLAGCAGWQSALDPHGVQAETLAQLVTFLVVICAAIWVLVTGVLLVALRRGLRRTRDGTNVDAQTERRMTLSVSAALLATLIIVVGLTAVSFVATRQITSSDPNALVIQVRGWQWWWEVKYPHPQAQRSFLTANEICVPVGRQVRLELAAADVIHSFWVPNLAGKLDMIPGRDNVLTFTATRPGTYRGQCAEFCGLQHAHMAFVVVALEPAAFEVWRAAQLAEAKNPSGAQEEAGRRIFSSKACASCHTVRGTPAAGTLGPDLTHVGSRRTIAAGLFETTRGSLAAWIADPQTLKPGNNMPMVDLTAEELQAVSAYMASLK